MRRSVRWRRAAVGLCLLLVAQGTALAAEVGTPDGRARASVSPGAGIDGASVAGQGNLGAFGFDNAVTADQSGVTVSNPPMFDSIGTGGYTHDELYGPPLARASLGTGGLTAGVSATGVLTNLAWPGPGSPDHVDYLNSTRRDPNQGAPENAGSFGGVLLPDGTGTWFTAGDGWKVVDQSYASTRSDTLVTVLRKGNMAVTISDVVDPVSDVLARRFEVRGAPPGARLAYYANMNPTTARVPRVPSITDGVADDASDFATAWLADRQLLEHFRPYKVDPAAATLAATGRAGLDTTVDALDNTYGSGVYIAVGGDGASVEHQAGLEAAGLIRDEASGTPAMDPFYDARDGRLSNSDVAIGRTAGAQAWDTPSGTVYLAAAHSAAGAANLVQLAQAKGFAGVAHASDADWRQWLSRARLPDSDAQTVAVATRALMLIRTAQDRVTGAIVAAATTQTPYKQDWVRDGSFFDYALLVAGYPEMVAKHNDFYRRAQSVDGHWDPILCSDGTQCDAVFPFEIDSQAFGVWALWVEYELGGNLDRLRTNWDAIRRGAEVLMACHDPSTGLQCYASEDDSVTPSQGAQGASTVYLGLRSAAAAARLMNDPTDAARYDARADELRTAARNRLCTTTCQTGRGYMIWPSRLLDPADPTTQASLQGMADLLARRVARQDPAPGQAMQYPMEPILQLEAAWRPPGGAAAKTAALDAGVRWLTHDVAAHGVLHFAERIYYEPNGTYEHTVGFPHVWSGTETYLAAAFVYGITRCSPTITRIGEAVCTHDG